MQTLPCPPWLCPEHESFFPESCCGNHTGSSPGPSLVFRFVLFPWPHRVDCLPDFSLTTGFATRFLIQPYTVLPRFYMPLATTSRSPGHFALPLFTLLDSSACRGQASTCNSYFTIESCPPYFGQLVPRGPSGTCRNAPGSSRHLRGSGSEQCRAHYDFRSHFGWQSCWVFAVCHSVPS